MRRTLAIALVLALCLGMTAMPALAQDAPAKTKLTVITAGGGFWETPMAAVEEAYERDHPDVDLNIEIYGYEQLFQVIEVKIAAGSDEYDVLAVDCPLVAAYTERGYINPLDEYFTQDEQAQFLDASLTAAVWDGKFMAAPLETSAGLMFYNKTLLKEAGIEFAPEDPYYQPTWEELVSMSKQFMEKCDPDRSKGYFGISFEQVSRPLTLLPMANILGEKGIGDDGFAVDGVLNTEGWVKALTFYGDLFKDGVSLKGIKSEEFQPLFYAGKALFHLGGPWNAYNLAGVEGFEFGMMLSPTFEGFESKTSTGSWHLGINKNSKQQQLAAEFIKYMCLGEGHKVWIDASHDVPALKADMQAILDDPNADLVYKMCVYSALNTGYPRPVTPAYSEFETVTSAAFEDVRNGADPKQALDDAVMQLNTLFRKYQ